MNNENIENTENTEEKKKEDECVIDSNKDCEEYNRGGSFARFLAFLFSHGIISFLIILFCLCFLYIILYSIITFVGMLFSVRKIDQRLVHPVGLADNFSFIPKDMFLKPISRVLFNISLYVCGTLSGIFLLMYFIYCVFRWIGLDWLLLIIIPFSDCVTLGLFPFFDAVFVLLFAPLLPANKAIAFYFISLIFVAPFFAQLFGVMIPGYTIDNEYTTAAYELMKNGPDGKLCQEDIDRYQNILVTKAPLIKIEVKDSNNRTQKEDNLSDVDTIMYHNCVKYNSSNIPIDADTIMQLNLTHYNEIVKEKCKDKGEQINAQARVSIDDTINSMNQAKYDASKQIHSVSEYSYNFANSTKQQVDAMLWPLWPFKIFSGGGPKAPPPFNDKPPEKVESDKDENILSKYGPKVNIIYNTSNMQENKDNRKLITYTTDNENNYSCSNIYNR